jgi:pimeloyl-CoA synthetase
MNISFEYIKENCANIQELKDLYEKVKDLENKTENLKKD